MKSHSRQRQQGRKESGTFLRIPTVVLVGPNFCGLSTKAKALLLDIGARFNGFNNGDLAAPYSWMKLRGWKSKDTLHKALKELLEAGMIELTRQGGLHGPSLYAFTWIAIHDCKGKLDIAATRVASGKWRQPMTVAGQETQLPPRPVGQSAPAIGLDHAKRSAA
jgi:hypothetical protein